MGKSAPANKRTRRIDAKANGLSDGSKLADLSTKPDPYVECRIHHAWEFIGYFTWNDTAGVAKASVSYCPRCDTSKEVYHRHDGSVMDRRYNYPDDYVLVGEGRVRKADVHLENMSRRTTYASADTMMQAHRRRTTNLKLV